MQGAVEELRVDVCAAAKTQTTPIILQLLPDLNPEYNERSEEERATYRMWGGFLQWFMSLTRTGVPDDPELLAGKDKAAGRSAKRARHGGF